MENHHLMRDLMNMSERRSIIDDVVTEREQQKELEAMKENQQIKQEGAISAELSFYLDKLEIKMKKYPPQYSPLGRWIGDAKWHVNKTSSSIQGVSTSWIEGALFMIGCYHVANPGYDYILSKMQQDAENASMGKQFSVACYTCFDDVEEKIKNIFRRYEHFCFSPFLYVLKSGELIYNIDCWKTGLFKEWFLVDGKPKMMLEMIKEISDEDNMFTVDQVKQKFELDDKEAMKMLKWLEGENKILKFKLGEYGVLE
jgi:hypothetical protein